MEHENEEEYEVTLAGVVTVVAFCTTMFVAGMGLGHLANKLIERKEIRELQKKYATEKETTEINNP